MSKNVQLNGILVSFILVFLYTGISKLTDFESFSSQIRQSPFLRPLGRPVMWLVPGIEILLPVLLLRPRWRTLGLYSCLILMLLFACYLVLLPRYGDYIPCDCGGFLEKLPADVHIAVNLLLMSLAGYGVYLDKQLKAGKKGLQSGGGGGQKIVYR